MRHGAYNPDQLRIDFHTMHNITSPSTSDESVEQAIQAAGKTAPRVLPADLEASIASEHYFTAAQGVIGGSDEEGDMPASLDLLTFCVLVLQNGFMVTGESACASPENFDAAIGRRIARQNAVQKMWPLLGYALRSVIHEAEAQALRDLQG